MSEVQVAPPPVVLAAHDPEWPACYESEAQALCAVLGPAIALLEHIGSTAVPRLLARPIIDVLAEVSSLEPTADALLPLGYSPLPAPLPDCLLLEKPASGSSPACRLFCIAGEHPLRHSPRFRDYLRRHPEIARAYAELKCHLASLPSAPCGSYDECKAEFITDITARAKAEARERKR